jgi:hypothetical protein
VIINNNNNYYVFFFKKNKYIAIFHVVNYEMQRSFF